jgi:hypothetical protein
VGIIQPEITIVVSLLILLMLRELLSGLRGALVRRTRLVLLGVALPLLALFSINVLWRIILSDA